MYRSLSFGSLLVLALASGCNNGLDHASAVKVMNSALTGTHAAEAHVITWNSSPSAGQIDVTLTNPVGGSAHLVGNAAKTASDLTTTFDLTLTQWVDLENNITLDGALHEAADFSQPLPVNGSVQLTGDLTASGAIKGAVDFDLKGSYSPTGFNVSGQVGGQSISATVSLTH
jgi:hypothetical protein